jgi:hypothetical protein
MAWIIDAENLGDLLYGCIVGDTIGDDDQYIDFIDGIMAVVTNHFGGDFEVEYSDDSLLVHITRNDEIPASEGGTIYDEYDPECEEAKESKKFE